MIRIYLDWNIISNLKTTSYKNISDFIEENKPILQFPYSPAHFTDLMKSYKTGNKLFDRDLETLENLSGKHFMRWGKDSIEPLFGTPREYFEFEKNNNDDLIDLLDIEKVFKDLDESTNAIGIEVTEENKDIIKKMFPNLKRDSSMWDLMKEVGPFTQKLLYDKAFYKDYRTSLAGHGFKLDPNSGNWSYDQVIKNIDVFLDRFGADMTFLEYVETSFKHKKEGVNLYEYYTTAYLLLDMIGYKSDKLTKPAASMRNIQADAEHSFYGAHCDFFVATDKRLRIKSQVLYNQFNLATIILEPSDFIIEVEKTIDKIDEKKNFLTEALSFCKQENLVEYYPADKENSGETYAFKLPIFYFNYFNYMIYTD